MGAGFARYPNLNLLLDIKVPSTSSLAAIAGYDVEDFGEIEFSARARANDGAFSIEDIITKLDGELTTSSIDGGIENLMLLDGVDVGVKLNTDTLHRNWSRHLMSSCLYPYRLKCS